MTVNVVCSHANALNQVKSMCAYEIWQNITLHKPIQAKWWFVEEGIYLIAHGLPVLLFKFHVS